jgi:REP element-mobilizing transposase RayT
MRRPRLKAPPSHPLAYYHCVSRIVNRDFVLGDEEKEKLVEFMRVYEQLYGLRVLSYCMMSNHFHIFVEVPQRPDPEDLPGDEALVKQVRKCLGSKVANELEWELAHFRKIGATDAAEALRERWFSRMWDVSQYMKVLKQRFSQWFNGRHKRRGTLWEDRFRSVLVEGKCHALKAMAAYIDLNPVRAGICEDPKDYRWCGYGEAVAGGVLARRAVRWLSALRPEGGGLTALPSAKEGLRKWRCHLFGIPEGEARRQGAAGSDGFGVIFRRKVSKKKSLEVLGKGGKLSEADYLRCKVRYFSDGAVLGGKDFVEEIFVSFRTRFGPARQSGARALRGLEANSKKNQLFNLRNLQKEVFG